MTLRKIQFFFYTAMAMVVTITTVINPISLERIAVNTILASAMIMLALLVYRQE